MAVRDEIREQIKKTQNMTPKQKLGYFWEYYKMHTIIVIVAIAFIITVVRSIMNNKDFCFYSVMMNVYDLNSTAIGEDFAEYAQLDTENYECYIDTTTTLSYRTMTEYDMATAQKMMALVQTKDLDVITANSEIYGNYAANGIFADLRTVLSAEEIERYQDHFYYIDATVLDDEYELEESTGDSTISLEEEAEMTDEDITAEAETHRHPENMEDPMPVGIFINDSALATSTSCYVGTDAIAGIVVNTQRLDTARTFLDYLWNETLEVTE